MLFSLTSLCALAVHTHNQHTERLWELLPSHKLPLGMHSASAIHRAPVVHMPQMRTAGTDLTGAG